MLCPSLVALGYDVDHAHALSSYADASPARVSRVDRGAVDLLTADGPVRAPAPDPLAVGDWLAVRGTTVLGRLPRRTELVRGATDRTSSEQVLAANVDAVAVVSALSPMPSLSRVERLLALAWDSGAQPLVVLTKADLAGDAETVRDDVAAAAPGVPVLLTSTETGQGLEELASYAGPGRTLALLGQSGVGKSSLLNALVGEQVMATTAIRADGKGRHTTTYRQLVVRPTGGVVIDTPGLRGVPLWQGRVGLEQTFADVEALARLCRFRDCSHQSEPGCAVAAAVADGRLPWRRLDSLRRLERELAWTERRRDARLASEERRKWAARAKEGRSRRRP